MGVALAAALVALGAAACGDGSPVSFAPIAGATSTTVGSAAGGYGSPGDAKAASRTIVVVIHFPLSYDPPAIEVSPGETVLFSVWNDTPGLHQFVLGDAKVHDAYEAHMVGMGSGPMEMPDESNVVDLEPGQTKQLAWTFPPTVGATVLFGSHQPGDYAHGLRGTITVSGSPGSATSGPSTTADSSMNHTM